MIDDLDMREPVDKCRVNINQWADVLYWCREFGCNEAQLQVTVREVGTDVAAVRDQLARRDGFVRVNSARPAFPCL
ncbi:MAG: hypothetical protein NVS3B5_15890 [Sphingomicrobium sp.]